MFLEDEAWRIVPWELEPEMKGEQDQLVDVLVFMPGLLEDQTRLLDVPDFEATMELVGNAVQALTRLFEWRWAWEARNPLSAWEQSRAPALQGAGAAALGGKTSVGVYVVHYAAVEIALYNAVLLCLLGLLFSELPPQQAQTHIAFAINAADPMYATQTNPALNLPCTPLYLRAAAVEIVRAFEYQLHHARSTQESALFWLFPFGSGCQGSARRRRDVDVDPADAWMRVRLLEAMGEATMRLGLACTICPRWMRGRWSCRMRCSFCWLDGGL